MSLTQWEQLKFALLERFTRCDSSSKLFEQLKERKQKTDETITSYYDAIIKLCHEYDPSMSQKMIISWLENGIKDSLKIPIKRQMKALSDSARTTQAFLKIAKDEQELQEENVPERKTTAPYIPYFSNTVSTTLKTPENIHPSESQHLHQTQTTNTREANNLYQQQKHFNVQQRSPPRIRHIPSQHRSFNLQSQSSTSLRNIQHIPTEHAASNNSSTMNMRQYGPCSICQRNNHRTIDCYYKKPFGCFLLAGTRDGGHSSKLKQHPSTNYNITSKFSSPIFINVQVNGKRQHAIIDTGSAVTIINQQLLKNIHHKKFMYKHKSHKSANSTSINIIGEIQLEIKIQGHTTLILADVATNIISDLLLGNDWIAENNVIVDSPQRHIFLTDKYYQIIATTPFIKPPDIHLPILLIDEITLPPYSEKLINV
ncbi:unnamed protein product, partial [Rotaria magnacalcarata]